MGLAAAVALACGGEGKGSNQAAGMATAAPREPGYRDSAKPVTVSTPPQYSKKYPDVGKLLVDYHWAKSPDRVKPQKPSPGGVYRAVLVYSPVLDWVNFDSSGTGSRNAMTHSNLLTMDVGVFMKDSISWDLTTRDGLAESYEQTDPLNYVFHFRDGVKWHNKPPVNGRAFTAADVKYTWEVMGKTGVHAPFFSRVDKIEVPDAKTLKVTTKQPYAPFLKLISTPQTCIFAREQWESADGIAKESIGTGPFIMTRHVPNQEVVYTRNPEFFLKDDEGRQLPYLDAVHDVRTLTAIDAQQAAFLGNQLDYFRPPTPPQFLDILRQKPGAFGEALPYYPHTVHALHPSSRNPILADVRVRRALSLGLDRTNTYIDTVWLGGAVPNDYLPAIYMGKEWPVAYDEMGPWFKFDPQQAKQLLAAAGQGSGLKLEVITGQLPTQTGWTQGAQNDLREIGVDLELRPTEATAMLSAWNKREWKDLHAATELSLKPVEIDAWFDFYLSTSPTNFIGYKDAKIDDLAERQRRELDVPKRAALHKEALDYLRDQVPNVILGWSNSFSVWQPYVHDLLDAMIQLHSGWGAIQFARAWMDERAPKRPIPT
jgi:peptide/nickel transport system substrate-binding protein